MNSILFNYIFFLTRSESQVQLGFNLRCASELSEFSTCIRLEEEEEEEEEKEKD